MIRNNDTKTPFWTTMGAGRGSKQGIYSLWIFGGKKSNSKSKGIS
jgi:hypothetical protein